MADYKKFSFLDDFELPEVSHDIIKQQLSKVGKIRSVKQKTSLESMPLADRLKVIYKEVNKVLGRYRGFVKVITSEDEFNAYIDKAIEKNILALDTETNNSLDPLTCKLMGLCLYIPNTKPVYVPVNHTKSGTDILLPNQVSEACIKKAFEKLKDNNTRIIYHNGKFDIRVCYNVTGVYLPIWWDTMIAAQLLNENELAKLKYQYKVHVDPTIGTYNIEKLFTGLPYAWIDPEVFALYAAIDAYDTYILQQKQQEIFEQEDMARLYNLFNTVEIPVVSVVSKMEDDGISIDLEFLSRLDKKYKEARDNLKIKLDKILTTYSSQISYYQEIGKLEDPINLDSSQQLGIILYDIMQLPVPPEGKKTGSEVLEKMDNEFVKILLDYKHYVKWITSFTDSWPGTVSKKDGKIHASFNQMGKEENNVKTGRFSSTNPNLQQVPSHEFPLRMPFIASTDYKDTEIIDNCLVLKDYEEVEVNGNWKFVRDLAIGDNIVTSDGILSIIDILIDDNVYTIKF